MGITVFELLSKVSNNWKNQREGISIISAYIEQIEFKKDKNDEFNLESVSYILKNFFGFSNLKKPYERYSVYFATKGFVDIIYQLDVNTQEKIKQYLLKNYHHKSNPKQRLILDKLSKNSYDFLNDLYKPYCS